MQQHNELNRKWLIALLLAPAMLFMGFILIYPLVNSIYLSFFNYQLTRPADFRFAPGENILKLVNDDVFWQSLQNTLVFTALTVAIGLFIGMLMAIAIDQLSRRYSGLRGVVLVPWVIPGVVVGYLFMYMFDVDVGIINFALRQMGFISGNLHWLMNANLAMAAIIITHVWNQAPFYMLMISASLMAMPEDMKEAAYCEGASRWQEFWYVILPNLRGIIVISCLLMIIRNFNNFPIIFTMTGGGPVYSTTTTVLYIFRAAFQQFDMGYASTIGVIWVIILLILSVIFIKLLHKEF